MPYIKAEDREWIGPTARSVGKLVRTPGELNYAITVAVGEYLKWKPKNYAAINEVMGVLECAKQEMYARVARPYEELKCQENGDVYE